MRRVFQCNSVFILVISLWFVQGCKNGTEGKAAGPTVTPGESSGKRNTPTPHAQNPETGKSTRPTGTIFDLYDAEVWQSRFNKESPEIPANGFKAFYFEDSTASIKAYSDNVPFPALNYANSGPHGIPAGRFNAYWIGKFEFPENTTWRIDLSQSNSVARILIDKREIYSGNESRSLDHAFAKGDHLIEIEYKNNRHTIAFSMLFSPVSDGTPLGKIDTAATGAEYWYAAAYESGKADLSLDVTLEKSAKPVVLFLSSYEVVRWNVLPADSSQVLAVFVDSHQPQSTVTGLGASVPVTTRKGIPYAYKLLPDCEPKSGCEDPGFGDLVGFIGSEFKVSLTGYTGSYNPASMVIPEVVLDPAKYREIEARTLALIDGGDLRRLGDVFSGETAATWQGHFIASEADIPAGKFRAFYFSGKNPKSVLRSELTAAPAIAYSWASFHGLDANDFTGYWIGKFDFAAPTVLRFRIRQGHAQTAIFVDKRPVLSGPEDTDGTCSLPPGKHLIEIQHVNNWHTIDFSVSLELK